jgi:hypothetical protein
MADPEAIQLLAWLKEVAELEGGSVQDEVRALGEPAHSDAAGFTALSGHALTVRFARAAAARAFLAKTGGAILEMEEWSQIAIVIEIGEHSFAVRAGIEKTDEDLKALSDAGG